MARYIDADALYASIAKDTYLLTDETNKRDYGMYLIGIKKKIEEAPTANVVEATDKSMESLIKGLEILGNTKNCADVVEVVRCKDCDFCMQKDVAALGDFGHFFCVWHGRMVSAIGYCYCGERRE